MTRRPVQAAGMGAGVMAGKLDSTGMAVLARPAPFRPERTAEERRIATLEHQLTVALVELGEAMRMLAWYADPQSRQLLRGIRGKLDEAGLGQRGEVRP